MSNYKPGETVWVFQYDESDKPQIIETTVTDYWEDTKEVWYAYNGLEYCAFLSNTDRSREALIDKQINRISSNFTEYVNDITQKIKELNEYAIDIQSDLQYLNELKQNK